MADIDVEQKKSGQQSWIWAAVAIVSVVALMLWLASQETTDLGPAVMEDDTTGVVEDEPDEPGTETVELAAIAAAPGTFEGRTIRVEDVEVAATLGPRAFWANISGQNPFLVIVEDGAGSSALVAAEQEMNLRGTVGPVTEEMVDEWIADGAVNEGARDEATFATHHIMADRIRPIE